MCVSWRSLTVARGRPCQLSHNDWSIHSQCFSALRPELGFSVYSLAAAQHPQIWAPFLLFHQGGMLGPASKCRVICHREVPKPQIQRPRGQYLHIGQLRLLLPTMNMRESSANRASQSEMWGSSKCGTPCLTVFMWATGWGGASFKHCCNSDHTRLCCFISRY